MTRAGFVPAKRNPSVISSLHAGSIPAASTIYEVIYLKWFYWHLGKPATL